ncbi:hypothetical protein MAR_003406 [Mya arenaria]|uniref:Uncharacterized protein n=1 Tax=Mya arenaria TaxID=6604 RepID=A0ABY7G5X3_MYAAR|nr:hypothetical protein MAR_003406 [Mya arenaria]
MITGPSTLITVGGSIAVILLVAVVLAVVIWKRGMLRTCFKNAVIEKTTRQPTAEVSTTVDNQQRVEYVNTASDGMNRNTGDSRDAQTYEKLNMTSSSDNIFQSKRLM